MLLAADRAGSLPAGPRPSTVRHLAASAYPRCYPDLVQSPIQT